jgi:protein ImuA
MRLNGAQAGNENRSPFNVGRRRATFCRFAFRLCEILYAYTVFAMNALPEHLESIHPALWRANQLARAYGRTVDTGYPALSAQLSGAGWPVGTLIELLLQQAGIGEMRLLSPALASVSQKRSIGLIAPQQTPHALGYAYMGVHPSRLMWLTTPKSSDALWSAEQILRTGSCGALVLWQQHIRSESLRRLLLAAQSSETLFVVVRPLACAQDASPAPLRLTLRPAADGVAIELIKRKGPVTAKPIIVKLYPSPNLMSEHRRAPPRIVELPTPAVEHVAISE